MIMQKKKKSFGQTKVSFSWITPIVSGRFLNYTLGGCSTTAVRDRGHQGLDLRANLAVVVNWGPAARPESDPTALPAGARCWGGAMGRGGEAKAPLLAQSISVTIRCGGWPGCPG